MTADGTRRLAPLVMSRVDDADGDPIGFLGIAEDVGAQRMVEELLVQALDNERALAEQLRAADLLKSDFVSSVSRVAAVRVRLPGRGLPTTTATVMGND